MPTVFKFAVANLLMYLFFILDIIVRPPGQNF